MDGHAVRTATLVLSGMVGALVLAVSIMGGYGHVWWAGLIALADDRIAELLSGRPPLFPDDKEPETAEDSGAEAPRVLH